MAGRLAWHCQFNTRLSRRLTNKLYYHILPIDHVLFFTITILPQTRCALFAKNQGTPLGWKRAGQVHGVNRKHSRRSSKLCLYVRGRISPVICVVLNASFASSLSSSSCAGARVVTRQHVPTGQGQSFRFRLRTRACVSSLFCPAVPCCDCFRSRMEHRRHLGQDRAESEDICSKLLLG